MTSIMSFIRRYWDMIEEKADPRVHDWFLMSSPTLVLVITFFYLYFVTKLGPQLMKNRPPMKIDNFVILYNAVQIISSAYVVKERARTVWFYFILKLLDLLDTVFFVLRKKQSQVTFLHVYHHTMVFTLGWYVTKFYPGGHIAFFGTVNAFVHAIMYSYYLITSLHLLKNQTLWWKKYITQLQLLQFFVTGAHALMALFHNCNFPKLLIAIGIPQDILMIMLFWDFYKKAYGQKPNKAQKSTAKNNGIAKSVKKVL